MAGIIAVYGLVVSVLIATSREPPTLFLIFESYLDIDIEYRDSLVDSEKPYPLFNGFVHLAAGLSCGLTGLAAGYAIGIVGDAVSSLLVPLCGAVRYLTRSNRLYYRLYEHMSTSQEYLFRWS